MVRLRFPLRALFTLSTLTAVAAAAYRLVPGWAIFWVFALGMMCLVANTMLLNRVIDEDSEQGLWLRFINARVVGIGALSLLGALFAIILHGMLETVVNIPRDIDSAKIGLLFGFVLGTFAMLYIPLEQRK